MAKEEKVKPEKEQKKMTRDSRFGVVWEERQGNGKVEAEKGMQSRTELGLEMVNIIQRPGFHRFLLIWGPEGEKIIPKEEQQ